MKVVITRAYSEKETLGRLYVFADVSEWNANEIIYDCYTLELPLFVVPLKANTVKINCIPEGIYNVTKTYSPTKGRCFKINDVPGRTNILIHKGNYKKDTLGCILVGSHFVDINKDGNLDLVESATTLKQLLDILPDEFKLYII
ncbi:MAG: hypothetical protein IMZ64_12060 [Bacteroidetes bacterium]|nr:hypothetical protein [Bacteroidota bacterium]